MPKSFAARVNPRAAVVIMLYSTLVLSLLCSLALQRGHAEGVLPPSADQVTPLGIGAMAPVFNVRTVADEPWKFDPSLLERPTVIITFRGGWCPYCNMHLSELRNVMPEIEALGVDVIFLSGDRPELLYSSLEADTREDIDGLGYRIFSDANAEAAVALGIAFQAAEQTIRRRREKGQDIGDSSMERHGVLPVPAVFVIGTDGTIRYTFVEANYKVRLPAADLLAAVRESVN
jgi:peroxiredoxin